MDDEPAPGSAAERRAVGFSFLPIGVGVGTAIGVATKNLAIGIAIGAAIGIALAAAMGAFKRDPDTPD